MLPKTEFIVIATSDYCATDNNELDLQKGCKYTIQQTDKSGWWYANNIYNKNEHGWIPYNLVNRITHDNNDKCNPFIEIGIQDYEVEFKTDTKYKISQQKLSDCRWWNDEKETGWIPNNYVQKMDNNDEKNNQDDDEFLQFMVIAIGDYYPQVEDELELKVDMKYIIAQISESGWWYAFNDKQENGWIPSNYIQKMDDCDYDENICRAINDFHYENGNGTQIDLQKGYIYKITEVYLGWFGVQNPTDNENGSTPLVHLEIINKQNSKILHSDKLPSFLYEFKCKCIKDYTALISEELSLTKDEYYTIKKEYGGDRFYAVDRNGNNGWCPINNFELHYKINNKNKNVWDDGEEFEVIAVKNYYASTEDGLDLKRCIKYTITKVQIDNPSDWWFAIDKIDGKSGWINSKFVAVIKDGLRCIVCEDYKAMNDEQIDLIEGIENRQMDIYQSYDYYDIYMMYPSVSTFDLCFVCNKDFTKCGWVPKHHMIPMDDTMYANIFQDWSLEFSIKMQQQKEEMRSQFNVDSMNEISIKNMSILLSKQDIYSNTVNDDDAYDAYGFKEYIGRINDNKGYITEKLNNILNDVWIKYYKSEDASMNVIKSLEIIASQFVYTHGNLCCTGHESRVIWMKCNKINMRIMYSISDRHPNGKVKFYDMIIQNCSKDIVYKILKENMENSLHNEDILNIVINFLFLNGQQYVHYYPIVNRLQNTLTSKNLNEYNDIDFLLNSRKDDEAAQSLQGNDSKWMEVLYGIEFVKFIRVLYPFIICDEMNKVFEKYRNLFYWGY